MAQFVTRSVRRQKVDIMLFNVETREIITETRIIEAMPEKKIVKYFEKHYPNHKVLCVEVVENVNYAYRMTVEDFMHYAEEVKNE